MTKNLLLAAVSVLALSLAAPAWAGSQGDHGSKGGSGGVSADDGNAVGGDDNSQTASKGGQIGDNSDSSTHTKTDTDTTTDSNNDSSTNTSDSNNQDNDTLNLDVDLKVNKVTASGDHSVAAGHGSAGAGA